MRPIYVKQLDYYLTPTAGLALVGQHLSIRNPNALFKPYPATLSFTR